jgi:hypothetical protein
MYNSGCCCSNLADDLYNYCIKHSNCNNIAYEIINKAIGINEINSHEIYKIFKVIDETHPEYERKRYT